MKKYNIETIDKAKEICPIYLHSFDYGTIKYWSANTELPNNFLVYGGEKFNLTDVAQYATGVGFQDRNLWDYSANKIADTFYEAKDLGLIVHIWTFQDDVLFFNAKTNIVLL